MNNILVVTMKYNRFILHLFILVVLLISITEVSAVDLNDTVDSDVLNDVGEKSYDDLNLSISNEDSKFTFESDYTFNDESDKNYSGGIDITKDNFVIDGKNHKIDCNGQSRAFDVTGKNVEINNLIIENGFYGYGSAIRTNSQLTLNNVTFINCSGNDTYSGGAIYSYDTTLKVNNCKFIDNGGENGASITSIISKVNVANSTFYSSSWDIIKGHIFLEGSDLTVVNSNFLNTTSKYAAAIFSRNDGNLTISNSKFKNLTASKTAGAIGAKVISKMDISNCEFDNVSSENNGGAIFVDVFGDGSVFRNDVIIKNTLFNNCYSGFGGAILQLEGNLNIKNTNFTSNSACYEGGAIYTSHTDVEIYNSKFISNYLMDDVSYGGACYFDEGSALLKGNDFKNNNGSEGSAIYAYDNSLNLNGNYFNNPSVWTSVSTVYGKVVDNNNNYVDDVTSFNNVNDFYNFEGTPNQLNITNNSLSFDKMPAVFDLREKGWVTPVKDQGFMGACWAFGNMAALESSLLRYTNKTYSLSVNNMQNSMLKFSKYGEDTIAEGGNAFTAVAYVIDWLGVILEDYDGYDELGKISSLYITPENIRLQNVVVIPTIKTAADRDLIKNALVSYGAVAASHRADFNKSKYFNESSSAQYYYGSESDSTHRICIVGWNDTYSKYNFLKTPEGDGAWICKNSWGTNWGDGGYFYLSYYDKSFADKESVCYIINNDSYNRIYQHDVGGEGKWLPESEYYANIFTADKDELIGAVGTFFNQSGRKYEFTISVNDVDVYTQTGVSKLGGYETIKLDKLVQIKKGDKFKVTFKNMVYVAHNLRIHTQSGQSFVSDNTKEWEDLSKVYFVAILKAYTVSDLNITRSLVKYYKNDTPFVAKVGAGENVTFQFKGIEYTVKADENGLAKLNITESPGKYSITTTYNGTSIVNYIIIKNTVISSDVERGYNSNYDYKLKVVDSAGNPLKNTYVKISLNNGKYKNYKSDKTGYVTIKFTKLTKKQTIKVKNPSTGEVKTTTIKVVSRFSGASNIVMYYFDGSKFKAKIIGNNAKAVGKGQIVTIKFNKKTYKVKTSAKGYISLKMPRTLKPGTYKLTATYKGQTIKKTIKVKQNLKTKKYTVKKSAKKLVVKATLKNGKKAVKGKKLILKLNGKKFTAKTNKYGIAKFTIKKNVIKKLKKGKKYTMKVTYLKNTIKTTVKVK